MSGKDNRPNGDAANGNGADAAPETPRVPKDLLHAFHEATETMSEAVDVMTKVKAAATVNGKKVDSNRSRINEHSRVLREHGVIVKRACDKTDELITDSRNFSARFDDIDKALDGINGRIDALVDSGNTIKDMLSELIGRKRED